MHGFFLALVILYIESHRLLCRGRASLGSEMLTPLRPAHGTVRLQRYARAGELIDHLEDANRTSIRQLVADEVRRPALVGRGRQRLRHPLPASDLLTFHAARFQVFLVI